MSLYVAISLAATVISASAAGAILTHDPRQTVNRLGALLLGGGTWWSVCSAGHALASGPAEALFWERAGAPGWIFIGPLGLHLMLTIVPHAPRAAWRALPFFYAGALGFLGATWSGSWVLAPGARTAWGWAQGHGPGFTAWYAFSMAHILPAIALGLFTLWRSPSASERVQVIWLGAGMAIPLVVASTTDVLLPMLGAAPVPLGALSFSLLGATIVWTALRYGYSPLAHGSFSRQILDAHPDGVALVRMDGSVATASDGLARLVGTDASALRGRFIAELLDPCPVDPPREVHELEASLRTREGRLIPAAVSTRIFRDKRGLQYALVVVIRDLREVEGLRARLVTSGRLAAIGQLAAGIAHEINNPMAFVRTNLSLLRSHWERLAKGPASPEERDELLAEGDELLAESLEGVARACAIVRDINSFSHAGSGERESVDLNALLENTLRVAAPHLDPAIRVERCFGEIPPALGAIQELKQVFLNLLLNAAQATRGRGTIRIVTAAEGDQLVVRVEDDGCGIPAAAMEQIFNPFFTTKPVGEGTGMGLFISYQIVKRLGGVIRVESEPDTGTRVSVQLPAWRG